MGYTSGKGSEMTIMRLPAKWYTARDRMDRAATPLWSRGRNSIDRPADELLDLYGVVLVAVPLAFFLRWLWP